MNFFSLASGKISSVPTFVLQGFRRRKETEKRVNKIFKEIMTKNFPNLGKETHPGLGMTESFKQDELKEVHNKT